MPDRRQMGRQLHPENQSRPYRQRRIATNYANDNHDVPTIAADPAHNFQAVRTSFAAAFALASSMNSSTVRPQTTARIFPAHDAASADRSGARWLEYQWIAAT